MELRELHPLVAISAAMIKRAAATDVCLHKNEFPKNTQQLIDWPPWQILRELDASIDSIGQTGLESAIRKAASKSARSIGSSGFMRASCRLMRLRLPATPSRSSLDVRTRCDTSGWIFTRQLVRNLPLRCVDSPCKYGKAV